MSAHSHELHEGAPHTEGRTIRWARFYDPLVKLLTLGRARAIRRRTIKLAHIRPGETVLDVGCGTGDLTMLAGSAAGPSGKVCGIDASPEMIEVARRKAAQARLDILYEVEPIEAMSFPGGTFDVVLSSLMMHHLPADLKRRGLAEIRRVLKPGGRLLVVDIRRPTTKLSRVITALMFHAGMQEGVQDLPVLMRAEGFTDVETGDLHAFGLGFARARTVDSGKSQ